MSIWMDGYRFDTDRTWWAATKGTEGRCKERSAVGKAEPWKRRETKSRFPTAHTVPWKFRQEREIPTFPPRRLLRLQTLESRGRGRSRTLIWAVQKWKSKSRIPTFTPPQAPQAQGRESGQITNY